MTSRGRSHVVFVFLVASAALAWDFSASAQQAPAQPIFDRIFARFNTAAPPAYRAFRRMEAGILDSKNQGWMEVWTEYQPAKGFSYQVVREDGSEYVRNKVLRKLLENEQELLEDGKPLRAPLEPRNYSFEMAGSDQPGLERILLKPARKSDGIVTGSLLLSPDSGGIVGMEGRLVKSPSFWVRDVDVKWTFARAGEHIVPVQMDTTGRVRFYGRSYFRMYYDYERIEGLPPESRLKAAGFRD